MVAAATSAGSGALTGVDLEASAPDTWFTISALEADVCRVRSGSSTGHAR